MIVQLRLDERLIHGQIATQWSRALDITTILVANDRAANDELTRQVLLMTDAGGKKVAIKEVGQSIRLLQDPRAERMKVLIIVDNPKDAVTLTEALDIKEVNVANYQRKKSGSKVRLTEYCVVDPEDLEQLRKLVSICGNVYSQMIPASEKQNMKEILDKLR